MSLIHRCWFCHKPVDKDNEETYREVTSWVNGPKLDGPKLRTHTGALAHKSCIDNLVAGQAPDQEGLFDDLGTDGSDGISSTS